MNRWITPLASLAGTMVMFGSARGQEPPTPVQKENSPVVAADKKVTKSAAPAKSEATDSKSDAPDAPEPKKLYNYAALGYTTWTSGGYENGMHQNGYVLGGLQIADLSILQPFENRQYHAFDFMGVPGEDYGTRLVSQFGAQTTVTATAHRFSFYEPSFGVLDPSHDLEYDATLTQQLAPNFAVYGTYRFEQEDHVLAAPIEAPKFINRTVVLGTSKQVGDTTVAASYTETRFSDLNQVQPITLTDRGDVLYMGNWGKKLSTQGTVAISRIQQQGRPDSWIRDYGFSGVYDLTENSALGANVGQTVLDLNSVQNAYVRKRLQSGINYDYHFQNWGLDFGFRHREEERVRADHSFVDVPKWDTYDFKANGRISAKYRLGLKGSWEDLTSAPVFVTDDPTLLYWDRKASAQIKLNEGSADSTGYLSYTYRYRRSENRNLAINWNNLAIGGSKQFGPKLLAYAEFASDEYSIGGPAEFGSYFPTSETFVIGADFTKNPREEITAVLTSFYTQDQWGQQIALTYHRNLNDKNNFEITYSPWLQRDRLYDVDSFDARILSVKLGTRF